ncbi:MAG: hypothetical protein ABI746_12055 [Dermatophilaceae bacterium]
MGIVRGSRLASFGGAIAMASLLVGVPSSTAEDLPRPGGPVVSGDASLWIDFTPSYGEVPFDVSGPGMLAR